jgi:O-ureido-D-serine cyclo-ligase
MRVAQVTTAAYRHLDLDLATLPPALARAGAEATIVDWHDTSVDWASFDGAVIRSTWDYIERLDEFLAWTEAAEDSTRLANPSALVRWNSSKRYLLELAALGVPTVPTVWARDGSEIPPAWADVVVKPAVSAGSRLAGRFRDHVAAGAFVNELAERGDVLVQPYLPTVDVEGEIAVFFFSGQPSHAVRKGAVLRDTRQPAEDYTLALEQSVDPLALADAPTAFARSVLDALPGSSLPLYARVDCVHDGDGKQILLEIELIEPSLFLSLSEGAVDRFAAAVVTWLT